MLLRSVYIAKAQNVGDKFYPEDIENNGNYNFYHLVFQIALGLLKVFYQNLLIYIKQILKVYLNFIPYVRGMENK